MARSNPAQKSLFAESRPSYHHCHARGCKTKTDPEMLMCGRHWRMVPYLLKQAVWHHYRDGQCIDKKPSREWHAAADAAIRAVFARETSQ